MKSITLFILLILTHSAFSQNSISTEKAKFIKDSYNIQYPKTWKLDTSKSMGVDLFIFSPLENETDKFRENVNILIQDLRGQNIDLEKN